LIAPGRPKRLITWKKKINDSAENDGFKLVVLEMRLEASRVCFETMLFEREQ
jgi:hypothetical protein